MFPGLFIFFIAAIDRLRSQTDAARAQLCLGGRARRAGRQMGGRALEKSRASAEEEFQVEAGPLQQAQYLGPRALEIAWR